VYQWVERFHMAEKVSLMKKAQAIWPLYEHQTMLNRLMFWFKRTDTLLSLVQPIKLGISCGSAYSTTHKDLGSHKICASGYKSSLKMSTNGHVWKCACNFCSDIIKERLLCNELSQATKHGEPLWTCK
jgi:hypothetical protein